MKIFILVTLALMVSACASKKRVFPLKQIDAGVLKVQIEADKKHNNFVSPEATQRSLDLARFQIGLLEGPGYPLLLKYTRNQKSYNESVKWSKVIAKNRYATTDKEKLKLVRTLILVAIKKGDFHKNDQILNCEKRQFNVKNYEEDVIVSFYPTIQQKAALWGAVQNDVDGNAKISEFFATITAQAKEKNLKSVKGVLFASTKSSRKLQYCEVELKI